MFVQYTFPNGYRFELEYVCMTKEKLQDYLRTLEDPLNHAMRLGTTYRIM